MMSKVRRISVNATDDSVGAQAIRGMPLGVYALAARHRRLLGLPGWAVTMEITSPVSGSLTVVIRSAEGGTLLEATPNLANGMWTVSLGGDGGVYQAEVKVDQPFLLRVGDKVQIRGGTLRPL